MNIISLGTMFRREKKKMYKLQNADKLAGQHPYLPKAKKCMEHTEVCSVQPLTHSIAYAGRRA